MHTWTFLESFDEIWNLYYRTLDDFNINSSLGLSQSLFGWKVLLLLFLVSPSVTENSVPTMFEALLQAQALKRAQSRTTMEAFEHVVHCNPEKLALVSVCEILSYASLNERVNQLAHYLHSLEVGPEVTVAVVLERGVEYIIAMLACWKLGATYLPIDQSLPAKRMDFMMSDSRAACLITVKRFMEEKFLASKVPTSLCLDNQELVEVLRTCRSANAWPIPQDGSVAYIIYTSGTTGNPKGVAITRDSVSNLIHEIRQSGEIEPSDRVLLFSPFYFDASIRDVTGALTLGASLYIPQVEEILPDNLINTIAQRGITNTVITPSVLRNCTLKDMPNLKTIVLAGEAADEALIRTWGAGRKLINAYGPTEATVYCAKQVYVNGQIPQGYSASVIGTPILNTTVSILDCNNNTIEHGQVGEICVTGPGVSLSGYLNMPELNAERFIDGLSCHYRSYKTGDLGRILSTGKIECLGRKEATKQIKLNGQRIELQEVENVIRSISHVLDVVVIPEGAPQAYILCAYVVPEYDGSKNGEEAFTAHLKMHMRANLPSYSVPSLVKVIDAFQLSANEKIDVKALSKLSSNNDMSSDSTLKTTLTPLEVRVAVALLESMSLPTEQAVSPETTYGELGGCSLQASLVLRHLNKQLGCNIGFGQFFRRDISVRHIAKLASGGHQEPSNPSAENLLRYSILPHGIKYNVRPPRSPWQMHVLLTGCTGFLGSHLLAEMLSTSSSEVSCIVRAPDKRAAVSRVKAAVETWGLWDDSYETCFNVFCGDVGKPFLGLDTDEYLDLARRVDTVYHSAAAVSFIAPFAELEEVNITGTVEILRFASTLTPKRLTYVSTLSVFFNANIQICCGKEAPVNDLHTGLVTGYAQCKWVSEQLVHEFARLGGHALILRPGRLLGNTQTYRCPPDDFTIRLIESMLETKAAPNLYDMGVFDWQLDLTPVDFCARLIHQLSLRHTTGIRHIINKNTISYEIMVSALGGHVRQIRYSKWLQIITRSSRLAPLSSLFHEPVSDENGLSIFETLLHMPQFRHSCYQTTVVDDSDHRLPSTMYLLKNYLAATLGVFPDIW